MSGRNWYRDDPVRDAEDHFSREAPTIGICEHCGQPIYEYEDYYCIDDMDVLLHDDCGLDWLNQFKKYT